MHTQQMHEAEEQDTCRICSAPAELDQPLFYPCKCAGTIRYIHQDCLTTWLAHSKKKNCDVCKYPYSFTKVYAPDMPTRLPPVLLLRRLAQQSLFMLLFGIRAIAVGIIWLAILPWITVWTWRMYFSVGDSAAWWISDRPRPPSATPTLPAYLPTPATDASVASSTSLLVRISSHPLWLALSADIFTGQIIASLVVLAFVAVFLLREWISQNARPGVFDDDELFLDERPRPQPAVEPHPPPAPLPPPPLPLAHRLAEAQREVDAAMEHGTIIRPTVQDGRWRRMERDPSSSGEHSTVNHTLDPDMRAARARRKLHRANKSNISGDAPDLENLRRKSFSRRVHATRLARLEQREDAASQAGSSRSSRATDPDDFELDFTVTAPLPRRGLSEPPWQLKGFTPGTPPHQESPFPPVELEPPLEPVPFAFPNTSDPSSKQEPLSPHTPTPDVNHRTAVLAHGTLRRPPLPSSSLPASDDINSSSPSSGLLTSLSSGRSRARIPLSSPSLATYKAPEELEAGPSTLSGYFDPKDRYMEDEPEYFRERSDDEDDEDTFHSEGVRDIGDEQVTYGRSADGDDDDEDDEEEEDILDGVDSEPEVAPDENPLEAGARDLGPGEPQQGAVEPVPAPEANDDLDGNVEDDVEGAMEALGMRGPIYGVVQNAALMILVLDTVLGLGIWIPFTIGKSAALLSLDPYRFLHILHLPIQTMRIVTDPVVDSVVFLIVQFVLPSIWGIVRWVVNIFLSIGLFFLAKSYGQEKMDESLKSFSDMYRRFELRLASPKDATWTWSFFERPVTPLSSTPGVSKTFTTWLGSLEQQYADPFGKVTASAHRLQETWTRLALGHGANEKAFAVALGYIVVGLLLSIYLNILTVGNVRSAGRAVRSAVRQQLLVMKVATFIFIELVVFPLGCGIVLDLCTVWLFPEANLISRVVYFFQAPLTAMFYHWVAGTMFMYSFAVLLAGCRSIMRPGAMWFIKDPQDQNSHPIRDILDRPTLTQLRKICISGLMYSFVVACVVGSVAGLLVLGSKSIMPFRWKNREPLSNVPVDLLFLHQVLPYTMHYFRPRKLLKKFSTLIWKYLAHELRLTSYFFGERHPSEEYASSNRILNFFKPDGQAESDSAGISDGSFRRVPNTDHVALPRDMRATAAVHENGEPFDEEAQKLIAAQNLEAEKAKRLVKDDYIVVYIPPHFRYRAMIFIFLLWIIGAVFVGFLVAFPIQLGRCFFKFFTSEQVHDGYSFIMGFYGFWGCYIIGKSIDRLDKRRQRRSEVGPRSQLALYVIKRALLWVPNAAYISLFLGVVIPILVAFVVDLYVVLPTRLAVNPHMIPRIRVVDMWALGIVYSNIIFHVYRLQPENRIMAGVRNIADNGWTHMDAVSATKEVIAPAVIGLTGMIVLPAAVFRMAQNYSPFFRENDKVIFMHIYPGIFAFAGLARMFIVLFRLWSTWSQAIRDKEFLVEMRLRNLEPEKEQTPDIISTKDTETEYSSD